MRSASVFAFAFAFVMAIGAAGCGGDDGDSEHYDNLPDCVTDHTGEGLNEPNSITTCLLDHLDVSFATQAECEAYVNDPANGGYTDSATQACTDYFAEMQ